MLRVRRRRPLVVVRGGEQVNGRAPLESSSRRRVPTCNGLGYGANPGPLEASYGDLERTPALVLLDDGDDAAIEALRAEVERLVALGDWADDEAVLGDEAEAM